MRLNTVETPSEDLISLIFERILDGILADVARRGCG